VTVGRAAIAVVSVVAWQLFLLSHVSDGQGFSGWLSHVMGAVWNGLPVELYVLTLGVALDHGLARRGPWGVLGLHVIGLGATLPFIVWWEYSGPGPSDADGFISALGSLVVWPALFILAALVGYVVAAGIPGSFAPRERNPEDRWPSRERGTDW
jgi:hypothetical protein